MPLDHLRIEDMSDREFLLVMDDVKDGDGWTDSEEIRKRLDLARRAIASTRLSWLARWGVVEREQQRDDTGNLRWLPDGSARYTQRWKLTEQGSAMAFGTLRANQVRSLDSMDDSQLMEVTSFLTERARKLGFAQRKMVAREWRYGASQARGTRVA